MTYKYAQAGVPQESVLGQTVYFIRIHDISNSLFRGFDTGNKQMVMKELKIINYANSEFYELIE